MTIIFPVEIYQELRAYVDNTKFEISGFGKIKQVGDDFVVEKLMLPRQTVSPTNTIIDRRSLGKEWNKILEKEGTLKHWKLWWHSHADMKVFWSGQDQYEIEEFDSQMPQDNWMMSFETNHKRDFICRMDVFQPVRLVVHDIDMEIDYSSRDIKLNAIDGIAEKILIDPNAYSEPRKKHNPNMVNSWRNRNRKFPGLPILNEETTIQGDTGFLLPDGCDPSESYGTK